MKNLTTLCYLEKDNSYLMLHRVKKVNDENHDKWIGIGGHFEEGESPYDCAKREIYEETGFAVTDLKFRGIVTFVSDIYGTEYMHLFTAEHWSGELHECDEGNLEWVEKNKISSLPIWEGDKIFFRLLDEKLDFFSLKLVYKGENLEKYVIE